MLFLLFTISLFLFCLFFIDMCIYIYICFVCSWGPPAFFDLSGVSNASIQSAGAWVTASGLSATSDEDGVGVLNASRCRAKTS